jgi:predicted small metal-binding protein
MAYELHCGDVVTGCQTKLTGESETDVLQQAAKHAAEAHGLSEIDDDTMTAVKGAIRSTP